MKLQSLITRSLILMGGLLGLASTSFLSSCASDSRMGEIIQSANGSSPSIPLSYEAKIEEYSAGDQEYAGLYNNFEYKATLINAPVRDALVERQADYYKWDESKKNDLRAKMVSNALTQTNIYLSFFTPNNKNDNLDDAKKIWEMYLIVGGQRYEGTAKRNKMNKSELQALYPYANIWGTNYDLTFPVAMNTIENQPIELLITGPLGGRSIHFPAVK